MTVAYGADAESGQGQHAAVPIAAPMAGPMAPQAAQSAPGGVTITITGPIAEEMIGRGEAQEQQIGELVQKLAALEEAAAQRAAEQERLGRRVQELESSRALLSSNVADQVAQLRAELGRAGAELVDVYKFRHLQEKVGNLERAEATVKSLAAQVESLDGTVKLLGQKVDPPQPQSGATAGWGLPRSLQFWAALAAVVTATASALWLYA